MQTVAEMMFNRARDVLGIDDDHTKTIATLIQCQKAGYMCTEQAGDMAEIIWEHGVQNCGLTPEEIDMRLAH